MTQKWSTCEECGGHLEYMPGTSMGDVDKNSPVVTNIRFGQLCAVRESYASDWMSAFAHLEELLTDPCAFVRRGFLSNYGLFKRDASGNVKVKVLVYDDDFEVRRGLWRRPDLPSSMRKVLAEEFKESAPLQRRWVRVSAVSGTTNYSRLPWLAA